MFYKVFVHVHTDLVSLGSTKTLGARNTNWSSLSFASLLRDIRICIRYNNIYIYNLFFDKGMQRRYSQACRLLPVAQLLHAGLCHPVEIRWGEYVWIKVAVFLCFHVAVLNLYLRSRNSFHTSLARKTRLTLGDFRRVQILTILHKIETQDNLCLNEKKKVILCISLGYQRSRGARHANVASRSRLALTMEQRWWEKCIH